MVRIVRAGILIAFVSAALFGASTPLAKIALGSVDPWMMAGLLYLGAGVGLGAVSMARGAVGFPTKEAPLHRSDWPWLALVVFLGGVVAPLLLIFGLSHTDAASASLLLTLEGLATMLLAWIVFRENVDRRLLVGAAAILSGAALLSWQGAVTISWGATLIVGACIVWGIDNNLTRRLSSADPVQIAMIKGLIAGLVNVGLAVALGAPFPPAAYAFGTALIGFLGYGVSLVLYVLALRLLGAARTGAYFSLAPFVGVAIAVALLGEPMTVKLLFATALIAIGLWMHVSEHHDHEHSHEAIEHEHRHVHDEHHQHDHGAGQLVGEPHAHWHRHAPISHRHPHFPDLHHRHQH